MLGWGGTLPCSCVSASVRHIHFRLTHRPAPGCRVPRTKTPVPLLASHSARAPPSTPHTPRTQWPRGRGHEHSIPCRDITWGKTLRHYMEGGQSSPARTVTHSPGGGAGPDSTAPTAPALHTLSSAGSQRGAGGGAPQHLGLESPARCTSAPPYPLEAPGVVARGPREIPWTPVPGGARFARSPSTPPRAVPGGAAPWSGEAGAVCCGSRDLSRSCVSQPPHPCRSCAGDPGSPVPPGCEPPTPGLSRPARHGQRPPSPLAAAPTPASAAA